MDIPKCPLPVFVWAALLCTACDLPATHKCCGFTSHNSTMGCSECLKKFTIKVKKSLITVVMTDRIASVEPGYIIDTIH